MLKLLIAVDGSAHALNAIEAVAKMAHAGAPIEVVLVNVRDTPVLYAGEVAVYDLDAIEAAQKKVQDQILADAETRALGAGLRVRSAQRCVGHAPAPEIVRTATEQGVDQIVIGTHGRGLVGSLFLGSVAQRVVNLTQLPVMLVR